MLAFLYMIKAFFAPAPRRLASVRAVTFLEYALMAAIAVFIFGIIYAIFPSAVGTLFDNVTNSLNKA